ncbi:PIN domain-containing protein [Mycolicibacter longobardus]|uniref:PIN domain-containing protein n=1 Tax=Mycolicibacter longobardus TaxID=1108812 RepID=A0A1X1YCM6_9MYCO|nr:PIN domain-containing protein [Mycolicibacter longobardus]MCV7386328.1 PIN domain-containing protein [Mycolicibacter longobardus]ORW08858.1 hypothetical protein AWC16_18350 [Mycolicibacter longobardus]
MGASTTIVLPDANVLYSRTLRDWLALCHLEVDGWFDVRWTEDIMAEVVYRLRRDKPLASDRQIAGVRDRLVEVFSSGRIAGYAIDSNMSYPDIFDAHLHAAAVHGDVDIVITADKGFVALADQIDELPYEVHSPDTFFCLLDDLDPGAVQAVTQKQLDYWMIRTGQFNLCAHLERAGTPQFAERVRLHLQGSC